MGKFAWLHSLAAKREQLLLVGDEERRRELLDRAEHIVFLGLDEIHSAVRGCDHRRRVTARKAFHEREMRRRSVPVALLSDGTDLETTTPHGAPTGS